MLLPTLLRKASEFLQWTGDKKMASMGRLGPAWHPGGWLWCERNLQALGLPRKRSRAATRKLTSLRPAARTSQAGQGKANRNATYNIKVNARISLHLVEGELKI